MQIGKLRKQVTIQAESSSTDSGGGYALAWSDVATVWADIEPLSGSKIFAARHLEGHVTHRITMRWRNDVALTTKMRLLYNSRVFNIRSVLNQGERNQVWELLVEEGGAV